MPGNEKGAKGFDAGRRRWLTDTLRTAVGVGLVAVTLGVYQRQARALPATAIRPPGGLGRRGPVSGRLHPLRSLRARLSL